MDERQHELKSRPSTAGANPSRPTPLRSVTQCGGPSIMAKALLGYVGGSDPRLLAEMRRLQQRVQDLESELVRIQAENDALSRPPLLTATRCSRASTYPRRSLRSPDHCTPTTPAVVGLHRISRVVRICKGRFGVPSFVAPVSPASLPTDVPQSLPGEPIIGNA